MTGWPHEAHFVMLLCTALQKVQYCELGQCPSHTLFWIVEWSSWVLSKAVHTYIHTYIFITTNNGTRDLASCSTFPVTEHSGQTLDTSSSALWPSEPSDPVHPGRDWTGPDQLDSFRTDLPGHSQEEIRKQDKENTLPYQAARLQHV